MRNISFFSSFVSAYAEKTVGDVLASGMLSEGERVREFEEKLEDFYGARDCSFLAVNSGTSALHLALEVIRVDGLEVLLPANTFVSTGLAVLMAGGTPVFCDILPDGTIDPNDVLSKIHGNTGAVIGVNWAGKRCENSLDGICKHYGILLILDAAQSFGTSLGGDITCFSFQATKHLTTGDGGGMWFKNRYTHKKAKELRWFGINKESPIGLLGEREYSLSSLGYKYHMNDYAAALGLANVAGIDERLYYYKKLAQYYIDHLISVSPVHKTTEDNSFWAFPIETDDVVKFTEFCRERGVPCSIIHRGIDHNPIFGGVDMSLNLQRNYWEKRVTHLPIHMGITLEDVKWICDEVNQYGQ